MSIRLKLLSLGMRLNAKPFIDRAMDPKKLRKSFEFSARYLMNPTPNACYLDETIPNQPTPISALWIAAGKPKTRQVLLYFHGGGYVVGSPHTHRHMLARLSKLSGFRVFSPDYRLAPENPYPAALEDARAAHAALLAKGYHPGDIAIGGDSAGGGLALALLAELCQADMAPAALFAFSPWTDLTMSGNSLKTNEKSDHILPVKRVIESRDRYANNADPQDPGMSPLFAQFPKCPPVFIQYSTTEILRDDSARMAQHLRAQGADVTEDEWDDAPHVWHMMDGWVPEARTALEATAYFLRQALSVPPRTAGN